MPLTTARPCPGRLQGTRDSGYGRGCRRSGTHRFYAPRQRNNLALLVDMPGTADKVDTALATKTFSEVIRGTGVE